jgi:hypothetical protein
MIEHMMVYKYTMNPAASHQSKERIHQEVNRHLRPMLDQMWKADFRFPNTESMMDAGVALAFGIYNRMPHDFIPRNIWYLPQWLNKRLMYLMK